MSETNKQRPKFLALNEIRLPLPGLASILHRVSGAGMFLMLPLLIWLLQLSLVPGGDGLFRMITGNLLVRLVFFGLVWSFFHHFCMGIRLLLIDIHIGVEKQQARSSAMAVMVISLALTAVFGLKVLGCY